MNEDRVIKNSLEVSNILDEILNDLNMIKSKVELVENKILEVKQKKENYEILKSISLPIDKLQEDKREIEIQNSSIEESQKICEELKRKFL